MAKIVRMGLKVRLKRQKIEEVIKEVLGEDVLPVVKKLMGKENLSEFKLAEQLKEDIRKIRNVLYRLYDVNLVEFIRKKDKKKGWYIYYWTFKSEQVNFLYASFKKKRLGQLKERLLRESSGQFYVCPNRCVRADFEQAVNFEYRCPECGELMSLEDSQERVKEIRKRVIELEKELKYVS